MLFLTLRARRSPAGLEKLEAGISLLPFTGPVRRGMIRSNLTVSVALLLLAGLVFSVGFLPARHTGLHGAAPIATLLLLFLAWGGSCYRSASSCSTARARWSLLL